MWDKMVRLTSQRDGKKRKNTYYPGGSATNKKIHPGVLQNMRTLFTGTPEQVETKLTEWKAIATSNMKYIISFLCDHYNKDLHHRIFFNCVLLKYNEVYGNRKKHKAPRQDAMAGKALSAASAKGVKSTPPNSHEPVVASQEAKPRELFMVSKTKRAIDNYICVYSRAYGITFTNQKLQDILNSCIPPSSKRPIIPRKRQPPQGPPSSNDNKSSRQKRKKVRQQKRKKDRDRKPKPGHFGGTRKYKRRKTRRKRKYHKKTKRKIKRRKKTRRKR